MGRPHRRWAPEEVRALREGVQKHGVGQWITILNDSDFSMYLEGRSIDSIMQKWKRLTSVNAGGQGPKAPIARVPLSSASPLSPRAPAAGRKIENRAELRAAFSGALAASAEEAPRLLYEFEAEAVETINQTSMAEEATREAENEARLVEEGFLNQASVEMINQASIVEAGLVETINQASIVEAEAVLVPVEEATRKAELEEEFIGIKGEFYGGDGSSV